MAALASLGLGLLLSQCAAPSHQEQATQLGRATAPIVPQMVRSSEATEQQLNLAHKQGYAQELAVKWYLAHAAPAAAQQPAGEYLVAYALAAPEGSYGPGGEILTWQDPAPGTTAHLRVFVRDAADGREVLGLTVRAAFLTATGQPLAQQELPFGWYPLLTGYGANVTLPTGTARLRLTLSALPLRRHDPYNGDRLTQAAVAEFDRVPVTAFTRQPLLSEAAEQATELVQAQGDAYHEALAELFEDATAGQVKPAGDYRVAYAIDYAQALWDFEKGKLTYAINTEESAARNAHLEVTVQEARTGRFVPGLRVTTTLAQQPDHDLATAELPLEWHPWVFHYGTNLRLARAGTYRLRVHADVPPFRRYGRTNGRTFTHPLEATFDTVTIHLGAK